MAIPRLVTPCVAIIHMMLTNDQLLGGYYMYLAIVCSHSLGSWVGLNKAIKDQSVIDICFLRHYCHFA